MYCLTSGSSAYAGSDGSLATTRVNTFAAASPAGTMNCWIDWQVYEFRIGPVKPPWRANLMRLVQNVDVVPPMITSGPPASSWVTSFDRSDVPSWATSATIWYPAAGNASSRVVLYVLPKSLLYDRIATFLASGNFCLMNCTQTLASTVYDGIPPVVHGKFFGSPHAGKPVPTKACGTHASAYCCRVPATLGVPIWNTEAKILSPWIAS